MSTVSVGMSTVDDGLYRLMFTIRRFEETVLEQFASGVFSGTTHTSLGQEANAVGVLSDLGPDDVVVSNHRCHGHFLAYGGEPAALFAELMGRSTGVSGGRGGSQQLCWRNFHSAGILGGTVPVATGMALAEATGHRGTVTVVFLGDGALGEGAVYEAFNIASLWRAPILYVVENNGIAQTTPTELQLAGSVTRRFDAVGIPNRHLDTSDVLEIRPVAAGLLDEVRDGGGPRALVIDTCRLGPHSKGDDTRSAHVLEQLWSTRDPLTIHGARQDPAARVAVEAEVERAITDAFDTARAAPPAVLGPVGEAS